MSDDWISMVYLFDKELEPDEIASLLAELSQQGWTHSKTGQYQCVWWDEEGYHEGLKNKRELSEIFTDIDIDACTVKLQYQDTKYEIRLGFSRDSTASSLAEHTHIEVKSLYPPLREGSNKPDARLRRGWYQAALKTIAEVLDPHCGYGSNGPEATEYSPPKSVCSTGLPDQLFDFIYINSSKANEIGDQRLTEIKTWSTESLSDGSVLLFFSPPGRTGSECSTRADLSEKIRNLITED